MYRFFVQDEQIDREKKQIHIIGTDVNHIKNVLRMKQGEEVLVSSGENLEYACAVEEFRQEEVLLSLRYVQEVGLELPSRIFLFQSLPKGDKMEMIIQKAVELGVYEVIPVETRRCVMKLDGKKQESKRKRWQGISESAAKQSRRMIIPAIHPVMKFADALEYARQMDLLLFPYELAEDISYTRKLLEELVPGQSIGIFIGPEGGFTPEEAACAAAQGARMITLGKRILRTETAGMTMLSILMFYLEGREKAAEKTEGNQENGSLSG